MGINKTTSIKELEEIGTKINDAYIAVLQHITPQELNKFEDYLSTQEAMVPLLDPTGYMGGKDKMLTLCRQRVEKLKRFFEL